MRIAPNINTRNVSEVVGQGEKVKAVKARAEINRGLVEAQAAQDDASKDAHWRRNATNVMRTIQHFLLMAGAEGIISVTKTLSSGMKEKIVMIEGISNQDGSASQALKDDRKTTCKEIEAHEGSGDRAGANDDDDHNRPTDDSDKQFKGSFTLVSDVKRKGQGQGNGEGKRKRNRAGPEQSLSAGSAAGPHQVPSAVPIHAQEAQEDDASFGDVVDAVNELVKADRRREASIKRMEDELLRLHADVRRTLELFEQQQGRSQQEKAATGKKRRAFRAGTQPAK